VLLLVCFLAKAVPLANPMLKKVYEVADVSEVNETFSGEGKGVLEILRIEGSLLYYL